MNKATNTLIVISFIFLIVSYPSVWGLEKKLAVVLPIENCGSLVFESLSTKIALYCNGILCGHENYSVVSLYRVKQVLLEHNIPINDVNKDSVKKFLSDYFNADHLIGGHYSVENNILMASLYNNDIRVSDNYKNEFVTASFTRDDFESLDTIFFPVILRLMGIGNDSAIITINPDMRCSLYVNDNFFSELPVTLRMCPGRYDVTIIYHNESDNVTIFDKTIMIKKGEPQLLNVPVFTPISVRAGRQCMVIIDGEEMGTTPFESKLFSGGQYEMKIVYTDTDSFRWEVDSRTISTMEYEPLSFSYQDEAAIRFVNHHGRLAGRMNNDPFGELKDCIRNIVPGTFRLQLALPEPGKGTYWLLYDKRKKLHPFEILTIDCETITYRKNTGLCFLPAASQFYNREYAKGWTVLSLFLASTVLTGVSAGLGLYYQGEYLNAKAEFEQKGLESGFNEEKLAAMHEPVMLCGILFFTGLGAMCAAYGYSLVDGIITMDHIESVYRQSLRK